MQREKPAVTSQTAPEAVSSLGPCRPSPWRAQSAQSSTEVQESWHSFYVPLRNSESKTSSPSKIVGVGTAHLSMNGQDHLKYGTFSVRPSV